MSLNLRAIRRAFQSGSLSKQGLQALASDETSRLALRTAAAIADAGYAPSRQPLGELLPELRQIADSLLRDELHDPPQQVKLSLTTPALPDATHVVSQSELWLATREAIDPDPEESSWATSARRIEAATARLVESANPVVSKRAAVTAELAQGRLLSEVLGDAPLQHIEVAGRTLVVHGATASEAEAIRIEFEQLTADHFGRGVPRGADRPGEVYVVDDHDYRRLVGARADSYDGRVLTYRDRRRVVLRREVVVRSQRDGVSVRQALLPSLVPRKPYMASASFSNAVAKAVVRGSAPTPELLRQLSSNDAVASIINTRLEDPGGAADRGLIERENLLRAGEGKPPLKYVYVPIPDHGIPAEPEIRKLVGALTDPSNQPAYVHCFAGIGRTGEVSAMAEIIGGESPETAVDHFSQFVALMGVAGEANPVQVDFILEFGRRWAAGEYRDAVHPQAA